MAAHVTATVNEDGIIEPEVICTRMDPEEYEARMAKIRSDKLFLHALTVLGECLVRPCKLCGSDARWKAVSYMRDHPVYLCLDCQAKHIDHYKSFEAL